MHRDGPLAGIRVLDLAGPSAAACGRVLAAMGADVIRVEPPGGCRTRRIGPFCTDAEGNPADGNRSFFFWHYNLNKRSIVLDLTVLADRERFTRLTDTADVIIETFRPGHMEELGIGFRSLHARHPRLIVASVTPFGQSGPYSSRRACDLTAQAAGGMLFLNGFAGKTPVQGYGLPAYHAASTHAAIGILLALLQRAHSGRGQHVDVSMQESVVSYVEHASALLRTEDTVAQRQGGLHWTRFFRIGRCRDGHVLHGTLGDWTSLVEWVKADGHAGELADTVWEAAEHRREQSSRLFDRLDAWAAAYTVDDLVEGAQLRRLPYAPLSRLEDLPHHPQLRARQFFVSARHPELAADVAYPGAFAKFSATPWRVYRRPPLLGEHTGEVLRAGAAAGPRNAEPTRENAAPLHGIRVVDFTWVHAGPVATRVLADHGAEVIKIERPDAPEANERRTGLTGNLNRGKKSVVLDMSDRRGADLVRELIRRSDVVIDNFSPRVLENWGLNEGALRALRSDIVCVRLSAFGADGPFRDRVAYAPTLHAYAGHTRMMRDVEGEPAGWGLPYSDLAAGCAAALATLLALWHRQQHGEGQFVDLSQFENLVSLGGVDLTLLLNGAAPDEPSANDSREGPAAPHGVYPCAPRPRSDRWCAIAVFGNDEWLRFARAIDSPPWTADERFATDRGRLANRSVLDRHVASWTIRCAAEEAAGRLQRFGVRAAAVADSRDLATDPHLRARRYWLSVPAADGDRGTVERPPFRLSETAARITQPAPLPGEHTDEILERILGLPPERIAALRQSRVVA